jgi:hypothetical protein
MKTKDKIIQLVEMGLSPETVSKLNETQIDVLFRKISLAEQVKQTTKTVKTTTIPSSTARATGAVVDGASIKTDGSGNIVVMQAQEGEMKEDNVDVMGSAMGGATTQAPHQIMSPDGMGDDSDAQIDKYEDMTEGEEDTNNPYAICHAQLGPKKNAKFERCVKAVKKSLNEGNSPMDFFIEERIVSLVGNYLEPKMTKGEFIETIAEQGVISRSVYKPKSKKGKSVRMSKPVRSLTSFKSMAEAETETAPVKPTTKPDTKPSVRPAHPGKKPFEGPNPAPKASKKEIEKAKNDVLKLIQGILRDGKK